MQLRKLHSYAYPNTMGRVATTRDSKYFVDDAYISHSRRAWV